MRGGKNGRDGRSDRRGQMYGVGDTAGGATVLLHARGDGVDERHRRCQQRHPHLPAPHVTHRPLDTRAVRTAHGHLSSEASRSMCTATSIDALSIVCPTAAAVAPAVPRPSLTLFRVGLPSLNVPPSNVGIVSPPPRPLPAASLSKFDRQLSTSSQSTGQPSTRAPHAICTRSGRSHGNASADSHQEQN